MKRTMFIRWQIYELDFPSRVAGLNELVTYFGVSPEDVQTHVFFRLPGFQDGTYQIGLQKLELRQEQCLSDGTKIAMIGTHKPKVSLIPIKTPEAEEIYEKIARLSLDYMLGFVEGPPIPEFTRMAGQHG